MLKREEYISHFQSFSRKNILIVGDVMIDAYLFGKVDRISPEAPVPVVEVLRRETRLGGAANVALNIQAMGANPILCSICGCDEKKEEFCSLLEASHISSEYIYPSKYRRTTVKFRVLAGHSQLLRIDEEDVTDLNAEESKGFLEHISRVFSTQKIDALIFEDYDKGLLNPNNIASISRKAKEAGVPILVDPKKKNFSAYHEVDLFKPNLREMREGLKMEIDPKNLDSIRRAGELLVEKQHIGMLLLTLSENGIAIFTKNKFLVLPAHLRHISDVSGAGDTVIALAALCMTQMISQEELAHIANTAGGLVCEYSGVVPIHKESLLKELLRSL